ESSRLQIQVVFVQPYSRFSLGQFYARSLRGSHATSRRPARQETSHGREVTRNSPNCSRQRKRLSANSFELEPKIATGTAPLYAEKALYDFIKDMNAHSAQKHAIQRRTK